MDSVHQVVLILIISSFFTYTQSFECARDDKHCVTSLYIDYAHSMYHDDYEDYEIHTKDRQIFYTDEDSGETLPFPSNVHINTADGATKPRKLIVANGTMPGPQIVLYEKQTISIIVHNRLLNDAVTIHWHGVDQHHTPFMDGVPFLTQCPIAPGQSFNYTFQPRFGGTFWYHSHVGYQRTQGLYGLFIILRDNEDLDDVGQVLLVSEYNHIDEWIPRHYYSDPQSVLINGKGEYENNEAPLEVISAKSGNTMRFRFIHAGYRQQQMLGIEGHKLHVIEIDGFPVEPITVDRIFAFQGERYDFTIDVGGAAVYNITSDMYEDDETVFEYEGPTGKAFLNVTLDKSVSNVFVPSDRIKVLNCPFPIMPYLPNFDCIPVSTLSAKNDSLDPSELNDYTSLNRDTSNEKTIFLTIKGQWGHQAMNYLRYKHPSVSAISQPGGITSHCSSSQNEEYCTHSLNLEKDTNITLVFVNVGTGALGSHPMHVHGHTFDVIKMGLPTVFENGTFVHNTDIICETGIINEKSNCSSPAWRDETWNERIPGILQRPLRKDTVVVPHGGYTVIRFRASNPGVWFVHCHEDQHAIQGMALVLNESFSEFNVQPFYKVPLGFPVCNDYHGSHPGTTQTPSTTQIPQTGQWRFFIVKLMNLFV